ncbi:SDR family oxidoreductase [Rhizobium sullae]|uniref:SDR family oxidoreductase n=1 Tax=Rhizobium sullae TaxID=50338 RepID=UPI000B34DA0A|nr:SDR family oxidoreductase [Rhizobium sullae]
MADKPLIAITGASSGIGEAVARAFSKAGHPLLLIARRLVRLEGLGLPNAVLKKADVRDRAALVEAVREAEAQYGPVDMMFANAGVARLGDIATQPPEDWDEMIARKHGTLMMMSSIAGRQVYPDHTVYCGTKFFVHAVSESLRGYMAPHDVRVIVISPGIIDTEVLDGVRDETTLANYKANKAAIGGGISAGVVADLILNAYQLPQRAIVQEIVITPTRQTY